MKFISFNINGLRARPHQLAAIIEKHQPEVIGLQETKVHDDMFPYEEVSQLGYHVFYHGQKAHYGVALLTKMNLLLSAKAFQLTMMTHSAVLSWLTFKQSVAH
ncbi:exodeoxyribonuclease III [Providencia rettgeri Dmel1]|nr:exodeoxyribonuclease III [Providencia rettgeri Dmel1]